MSTLAEIEAAVATLSPAEMEVLEQRLREMNLARRKERKVFTGHDAVKWWRMREHMGLDEGEAFARDVEAARRELITPANASTMGVVVDSYSSRIREPSAAN